MADDDFHVVDDEAVEPADDDAAEASTRASREAELDGLRIRQLATERRAMFRQTSYCVVAALFCAVAVAEFIWSAATLVRVAGWTQKAIGYGLFALLATWGTIYFTRRARKLHREATRTTLAAPGAEPDFSALGDGSQRWK